MSVKGARQRTESMAQRLAKQPISEGYTLWDKGYFLGAMRLFIFKAENSPPFQLGPCLEAIANLLARMEEAEDAKENFGFAADKYKLISQEILASIMTLKGVEATNGVEAALTGVADLLTKEDPDRKAAEQGDATRKAQLGRAYQYYAELLLETGKAQEAVEHARLAVACPSPKAGNPGDRSFLAMYTLGAALAAQGKTADALEQFEACIKLNSNYLQAYEKAIQLCQQLEKPDRALELCKQALELHPKSSIIRSQAFVMADLKQEGEALAMLDKYIAAPPKEEAEQMFTAVGAAVAVFHKAKAAIFADSGKLEDARKSAEEAAKLVPDDAEAKQLLDDIKDTIANP